MSTTPVPRSKSPADSTRRQLDELDALLQRMLALPVAPPDEDPIVPEEPGDSSLAVVDPPLLTPPPLAVHAAVLEPAPLPAVFEPPSSPSPVPEPASEEEPPVLPRPRRQRLWRRPLLWSNRMFDRWTDSLGAPGRWLQGRTGRAFLGAVGLLCLAGAVAVLALDWAGWIW